MTLSAVAAVKRAVTNVAIMPKMPEWLTSISNYLCTHPLRVFGKQRETWDSEMCEYSQSCDHHSPRVPCPHGTVTYSKGIVICEGERDGEEREESTAVHSTRVLQQTHLTLTSGCYAWVRHAGR